GMSVFMVEKDTPGFTTENPYGLITDDIALAKEVLNRND
ncbi:unnamed protein product, partial [marine sediment metagenome]